MPHVVFVAPHFPAGQRRFVRGLKKVGARVTGIGDQRPEHLDAELRHLLDHYEYVSNVTDADALTGAVRRVQVRGPWVDRLESTIETHMLPTAIARAACAIPGLSVEQVVLCRDKYVMKRFLRERGVPCARNGEVATAADVVAFVREVGFPVILKPRDGAGAQATYRLESVEDVERAVQETGLDQRRGSFVIEQFVQGHEGFFDTLVCRGDVVFEAVSHYYPNVLEAMRTRWISPQVVTSNRVNVDGYDELRGFGRRVIGLLGLDTTATHMEWFSGAGLSFSEIGARPPGCNFWDLYCEANDLDLYAEWARALCYGVVEARASRRFSAGMINLRPSMDGRIAGYSGVEAMQRRFGELIFKMHLPAPGTPTQPVEAGYLANAWVCVRHPDYDALREILDAIGQTVRVHASG